MNPYKFAMKLRLACFATSQFNRMDKVTRRDLAHRDLYQLYFNATNFPVCNNIIHLKVECERAKAGYSSTPQNPLSTHFAANLTFIHRLRDA